MSDVKLRLVTEQDRLAELDEDLAPALATSVERAAVIRCLRAMASRPQHTAADRVRAEAWFEAANHFESGGHV